MKGAFYHSPAWLRCSLASLGIASAALLAKLLGLRADLPISLPFLAAIAAAAWVLGRRAAFLAVALAALTMNFCFLDPVYSFALSAKDAAWLAAFTLAASLASYLASRPLGARWRLPLGRGVRLEPWGRAWPPARGGSGSTWGRRPRQGRSP